MAEVCIAMLYQEICYRAIIIGVCYKSVPLQYILYLHTYYIGTCCTHSDLCRYAYRDDILWYILHHTGDAKHEHIECLGVPYLLRLFYNTVMCMNAWL